MMKLTAAVKLLPSSEQADILRETLRRSNAASNYVSEVAFEERVFGKHALQKLCYHEVKARFSLSAQAAIQAIRKVADSYRLDNKTRRTYRKFGSIAYDDRILSWRAEISEVSIWTVADPHRQRIAFTCDERAREMLKNRRGESDLVYRDGKFYLLATVEVEEPPPGEPEDWLGVDLGIASLATDSDGEAHSGGRVEKSRKRYERIRSKLQAAGTKSAKRHLKKLAKRERRMKRDVNHCVSKRLVSKAAGTNRGISLEDLTGITARTVSNVRRSRRSRHGKWAFGELRFFIEYKARLAGVAVRTVDPRDTSRACSKCGHCEKTNRKSRDDFVCDSCGHAAPADANAAVNIGRRGGFMRPIVAENESVGHAPSDSPAAIPRAL
ncbi:MAG: RNA-guided endonuclease InsQ/TnpB family protein [Rubrobacteraceae bacterium]